jgi:hypothetical protein
MQDVINQTKGIKWLWRNWIPFGMVTLLFAPPGMGKSAFALGGIVKAIVLGRKWPDGSDGPRSPGRVVWVDTEASQPLTAARIRDWKLPPKKILLPTKEVFDSLRLDDQADLDRLRELVRVHKPTLVVIDSLRSAHGGDENNSKVCEVVEPLARLARDTNVPIVVVHHSRKIGRNEDIDQDAARGSNALIALSRSVIGIDKPDDESDWCRVKIVKSNVTVPPEPLGFRITATGVECGNAPERPRQKSKVDEAVEFLRAQLGNAPKRQTVLILAAQKRGIAEKTLRRAQRQLRIRPTKDKQHWIWRLPDWQIGQKRTARKR